MRNLLHRYLLILPVLLIVTKLAGQANTTYGVYKDWTYTETRVIGMTKITDTAGYEFDRIIPVDANTVRIDETNSSGVLTSSTIVRFLNGKLSAEEYTDQFGYLYKTDHYTPDGNDVLLCTETERGKNTLLPAKAMKYFYKNDLAREVEYISYSGRPCNSQYAGAYTKYEFYEDSDRYGRVKEMSFYDEDGNPTYSEYNDCHKVVYEKDKRGNDLVTEFYNEEGHKLQNRNGTFKITQVFDAADNPVETTNYGVNGQVTTDIYGVAKTKSEYKNGLKTSSTFYDINSNIVKASDTGAGFAITRYEYDNKGNLTSESYYDEKGEPKNNHNGVQEAVYIYSPANMLVEEKYFDKEGLPAVNKGNIHRYVYGRDKWNRVVSWSFFGLNNLPVKSRVERVYMIKYKYDSKGLETAESYWKDENTKMTRWDGVHEVKLAYNDMGQQTDAANFDEDGKPFTGRMGFSRVVTKYDAGARIIENSRFDGNKPVTVVNSAIRAFHAVRYTYDDKDRIAQIEYLDNNDQPTSAQIDLQGGFECSKIELKYLANVLTEERFYPFKSSFPSKTVNCLHADYVNPSGMVFGYKNR